MYKRFFNHPGKWKIRMAILCIAVLVLAIGFALPKTVFSGCGAITSSAKKGDVISITPENGKIVDGVITTNERQLVLYVEFQGGAPSFFQICDNELFDSCEWQRMRFDGKITFTLSEGAGMKKVYLRSKFLNRPGRIKTIVVNYIPR